MRADIDRILTTWSFERDAHTNWDKYHLLVGQMLNMGQPLTWWHASFLTWSFAIHPLIVPPWPEAGHQTLSAAGPGAAAFLHAPEWIPGCALSYREFELDIKLRLGADIHPYSQMHVSVDNNFICRVNIFWNASEAMNGIQDTWQLINVSPPLFEQ